MASLLAINMPNYALSQISETLEKNQQVIINTENKFSNELMEITEREEQSLFLVTVAISIVFVVCFSAVGILLIKLKMIKTG